jgi:hypothetical protein
MDQTERRVRQLAEMLWRDAGRPESGSEAYLGRAGELIAIKDNQALTTRRLAPSERAGVEVTRPQPPPDRPESRSSLLRPSRT